jgi:hypothetical protein
VVVEDWELLGQIIEQAVRFALETVKLQQVPEVTRREIFEQLRRNRLVIGKVNHFPPDTSDD